jgi:hypothetical protein
MIKFVFTLDYEIYGNGAGNLRELVVEPTDRLVSLFDQFGTKFVVFAEALEFIKIEEHETDLGIRDVTRQLRRLYTQGFEIGLHLHPWWANARHSNGAWYLDWSERNLCAANPERIAEVVGSAVAYLKRAVNDPSFVPLSFRGGLWLMQPTKAMAEVLVQQGVKVDSSVFKGGRIQELGLDYRPAVKNGDYWRFSDDVNLPDEDGQLLEIPIYAEMVPFWKMLGSKRLGIHKKVPHTSNGTPLLRRGRDFIRFSYPRKLDFCRMSYGEICSAMERVIAADRETPEKARTVVAIGHSKDLVDFETIARFLDFLRCARIEVTDFCRVAAPFQGTAPSLRAGEHQHIATT